MKKVKKDITFRINVSQLLPSEFKSAIKLLESRARFKYLILSLLQVFLAVLEVVALSILTITISLSLDDYTSISKQTDPSPSYLVRVISDLGTELQISTLLVTYVLLTFLKTCLSAAITLSSLRLLAEQAAQIGFRLNMSIYEKGTNLIRFGKSQENLSGVTGSLDMMLIGYLGTFSQLAGDMATILMVCLALFFLNFEASVLLIILFSCLLAILHRYVNVVASRLGQSIMTSTTELNRKILDSWLVYREVVLGNKVNDLMKPTLLKRREIAKSRAHLNFLPSLSKYIFELFIVLSALAVSGVQLWMNGISDAVSSFVLIAAASARLLPALLRLQGNLLSIKQSKGGAIFARKLLGRMPQDVETEKRNGHRSEGIEEKTFCAKVLVSNLSYIYPESTNFALKEITFSITPGTFTAITGSSGSGKSTLVDLILGFLEPSTGSILISDLQPVVAREVWPGAIAYVPQDVQIFEGSILENISLASDQECDYDHLTSCLSASGLLEDVNALDDGIHSMIGERGLKLSGGQRQRLGIARALYSSPKLLIFDEATSSLDPIIESRIANNVYERLSDKAVIVVAHRLSTIMNADTVIYLKDGMIAASGKFEDIKRVEPEFLKQAKLSGL